MHKTRKLFFRMTRLQNGKIHVLLFLIHQKLIKAMYICPQNVHYINKLTNDELFSWWKGGGFIFIRAESNIIHHICFSLPSCNLMSYKIVKKNDSQWKSGWIGQCRYQFYRHWSHRSFNSFLASNCFPKKSWKKD